MPKWKAPPSAAKSLTERWNKYCKALQQHEAHHAQIPREAAAQIRQRVTAIQEPSSCQKLKNAINAAADKVIAECREKEMAFDKRTDHGRKDGARFP